MVLRFHVNFPIDIPQTRWSTGRQPPRRQPYSLVSYLLLVSLHSQRIPFDRHVSSLIRFIDNIRQPSHPSSAFRAGPACPPVFPSPLLRFQHLLSRSLCPIPLLRLPRRPILLQTPRCATSRVWLSPPVRQLFPPSRYVLLPSPPRPHRSPHR